MAEREQQLADDAENGGGVLKEDKPKARQLEASYYSVVSQTMSDGRVMIGQDIEIFPDKELREFAGYGTRAFLAKDRRLSGEQFALLGGCETVPRVTVIGSYKNLKNPHLLKLIDAGIINWTPENRQRFALIFEKPFGRKVLESSEAKPIRIADERLISAVIQPAVSVLAELRDIDLIHGAIHPENVFMVGAEGLETIMLGECLSSAPSYWQHPMYEMAFRAMAKPSGRGPGSVKDDLYALGMCVAMMARGENFMTGKSAQQILHEKIELGSYAAVIGRDRIPGGISEFLRGVLNDDEDQRWDVDDAVRWLEGRRLGPKQSRPVLRAARPLVFRDQKCWDLISLAQAFSEHIAEAAAEIEQDQFDLWLKRNFDDKALKLRVDRLWEKEKSSARERLVCCMCMVLDPWGPVRYKGLSLFPAGFGTALAETMAKGEDIQIYAEILTQQLFNAWISQLFDEIPGASEMLGLFEKCRSSLAQKMPGYGIERVLYMLNPEVACLSPALKDFFVLVPGSLLLALENISRQANRPAAILDRHMIAFISVREPKMIDPHFGYVNSHDEGNRMIGTIRTLAAIQRRFSIGPVPGVCNWLISMTAPVIALINNHDLRQDMTKQVNRLIDTGNLAELLNLMDDRELMQDDAQRFARARHDYKMLAQEKSEIETYLQKRKNFGRAMGRQVAMIVSTILSVIIVVGYVVLRLMKAI